jgi:hypothetical protein
MWSLCKFLETKRSITTVAIFSDSRDEAAMHIANMLLVNTSLKTLLLASMMRYGPRGMECLSNALATNKSLREIIIIDFHLPSSGFFPVLLEGLAINQGLESFSLKFQTLSRLPWFAIRDIEKCLRRNHH